MKFSRLRLLENKWQAEGKSPAYKAKMRYYYRHREKLLRERRSSTGFRDEFGLMKDQERQYDL
jgi:hypothetical protein